MAAEELPSVCIIHGDDPFAVRRHVNEAFEALGDPAWADMNTTRLDGKQCSDDELRSAVNSLPFVSERRLVILTNPFARTSTDAARKRFLEMLDTLPPSTNLLLVVEDVIERKDWKSLPQNNKAHWIRKWLDKAGKRGKYQLCQLPPPAQMPQWIREEAKKQGGQFKPDAASALASHVGNDTQQASLEIDKLLTYVDFKRAVEAEDVMELTAQTSQADVFAMVDSLANGNTKQALRLLHELMDSEETMYIFSMVVRQFRLLVQARELLDEGKGGQVAQEMRQHPFVAEKLVGQARRFKLAQLEKIYRRLLEIDEEFKTGRSTLELSLDTFMTELAV